MSSPFSAFHQFLEHRAPGFWCIQAGGAADKEFFARLRHQAEPPASEAALDKVRALPPEICAQLLGFYQLHNGATLYADTLSEAAGVRILPVEGWDAAQAELKEWYADDVEEDDEEMPHILNGVVFGEVPHSGKFFVMPLAGPNAGEVFYLDHDGWGGETFARNFEEFLDLIIEDPASLLNDSLGCYTRYSDGESGAQWIPQRYVSGENG